MRFILARLMFGVAGLTFATGMGTLAAYGYPIFTASVVTGNVLGMAIGAGMMLVGGLGTIGGIVAGYSLMR